MRILVCGGRDFGNIPRGIDKDSSFFKQKKKEYEYIIRILDKLCSDPLDEYGMPFPGITIISGGARGADTAALDYAVVRWMSFKEFKADWATYGKAAGVIRNKQMLEEGMPNLVVAFPGGSGTNNMVELARKAGVCVLDYRDACIN